MPERSACHQNVRDFGRSDEIDGLERMDRSRLQIQKVALRTVRAAQLMERYIHHQNLTLFKKRLAEPRTNAEREVLLKLLADEQAKEPPLDDGIIKAR
jgi:hypothetical protein